MSTRYVVRCENGHAVARYPDEPCSRCEPDLHIHYAHYDCPVDPEIEWDDVWTSAVDGECPACGTENITPVAWHTADTSCGADGWGADA